MTNLEEQYKSALFQFAEALSTKLNRSQNWWFNKLLYNSFFNKNHPASGTPFGMLYSTNPEDIDKIRIVTQVDPQFDLINFFQSQNKANSSLNELSEVLSHLKNIGELKQLQIGIGISATVNNDDPRLYVGTSNQNHEDVFIEKLSKTKMWFPKPSFQTIELIDRIRVASNINGISKRYTTPAGYMIYFASKVALNHELLKFILDFPRVNAYYNLINEFHDNGFHYLHKCQSFAWAVGLDQKGQLAQLKLEVSGGIDHYKLIKKNPLLHSKFNELRDTSQRCGLTPVPHLFAFRILRENISTTIYYKFSPEAIADNSDSDRYLSQVSAYYDEITPSLQKFGFETFQAGIFKADIEKSSFRLHNLNLASRAGIKSGDKILDAGCGLGGPSIDIATNIENVKIKGVNISPLQVEILKKNITEAGLSDRIEIFCGDYHNLKFPNDFFDAVIFFESLGYSYSLFKLFDEVFRVLRPKGRLYIKDVFCKEGILKKEEQEELKIFNRIYKFKTRTMYEVEEAIDHSGLQIIKYDDISSDISIEKVNQIMFEEISNKKLLTEFGQYHFYQFKCLPIIFGEILASKS